MSSYMFIHVIRENKKADARAELAKERRQLIPTSSSHGKGPYIINGDTKGPEHVLYFQITKRGD